MPCHHRERWWLQPHGVPEPELQSRILLGLPGALGATWLCLVGSNFFFLNKELGLISMKNLSARIAVVPNLELICFEVKYGCTIL